MLSEYWSDLFRSRSPWAVRKGRWQWQFLGCALGLLIALAFHPKFSWLMGTQGRQMLPVARNSQNPLQIPLQIPHSASERAQRTAQMKSVATELQTDPSVQVAYALMSVEETQNVSRYWPNNLRRNELAQYGSAAMTSLKLREVMQRFPHSALARAAFLRTASLIAHFNAPSLFYLSGTPILDVSSSREIPRLSPGEHGPIAPTPELLADYLQAAQEGETLEPNNAFFPAMQAIVHFAWKREDEALQDLDRASQKTDWQEHTEEEVWGRWRLLEKQLGYPSSLTRLTVNASILFPHYSYLRELARHFVWQAMLQERAGNTAAGVALRGRMIRLGVVLRDRAQTLIGCLVGTAVIDIAMSNAGGTVREYSQQVSATQKEADPFNSTYDVTMQRLYDYTVYLHDNGFNAEARWVNRQEARNWKARSLHPSDEPFRSVLVTQLWWIGGLSLLTQVLLFGAIGIGVGVVNYRRRFACGNPRPLPISARYGIVFGTVVACVLIYLVDSMLRGGALAVMDSVWVSGSLLIGGGVAMGIMLDQRVVPFLLASGATLSAWVTLILLACMPANGIASCINQANLLIALHVGNGGSAEVMSEAIVYSQWGLLPLVLMGLAFLIAGRSQQLPGLEALVRGYGKAIVPTLAVLLFCYCGCTYATVVRESQCLSAVETMTNKEVELLRQQIAEDVRVD